MADTTTSRGAHRAPRPARSRRAPKAVLGGAALVVAGLLLVGGQGTFAYWNDKATVDATQFSAGKLDVTVANGQQGNQNSPYYETNLSVSAMLPGESIVATVQVNNAGDADFTWAPSLTGVTGALGPALEIKFFLGIGTAGQRISYPRNQTCTGAPVASGSTAARLNRGAASQVLCVQVKLPQTAGDELQGKTGSFQVALNATQALTAAP